MNIYQPGEYNENKLFLFLQETDDYFVPAMSVRVNLRDWAVKMCKYAVIFEYELDGEIIGLGATYFNNAPAYSFGTYVCVKKEYQKEMYGVELIQKMIDFARENGSKGFKCEIRKSNKPLVKFYKLMGLEAVEEISVPNTTETGLIMQITFNEEK
ncbi:Acetyltransferase (GNAT) family protein [Fibrobacter sp. UWT2]|uniref:GNAT family N-acetyltransferase n=1 Tax=Fibrobacter sp. UWT2 TaxID=1896224 RepID=UPI000917CC0D|nr:GNAT family N-acetyltransferase [Fibrobacter sp. UWT2]SHK85403.1 Acetyltransferase (GNAT) family protein [Fibrobacter sp. UWT2]